MDPAELIDIKIAMFLRIRGLYSVDDFYIYIFIFNYSFMILFKINFSIDVVFGVFLDKQF